MPPSLHWALVLLLCAVVPFFSLIWLFIELGFVKKIDPASPATKQYIISLMSIVAAIVLAVVLALGGAAANRPGLAVIAAPVIFIAYIVAIVFAILAMFSMRRSIQNYYNTVEPMGLRLSGAMTFFFNIIYFQYHFTRIANWKQTGRLE
jgi:ABC-type transport system involved in multi-copper enzyme maturation permease subunit